MIISKVSFMKQVIATDIEGFIRGAFLLVTANKDFARPNTQGMDLIRFIANADSYNRKDIDIVNLSPLVVAISLYHAYGKLDESFCERVEKISNMKELYNLVGDAFEKLK